MASDTTCSSLSTESGHSRGSFIDLRRAELKALYRLAVDSSARSTRLAELCVLRTYVELETMAG